MSNFDTMKRVGDFGIGRIGLITGDTARFIRLWFEVAKQSTGFNIRSNNESIMSHAKWFPLQNGGSFRKWYGNLDSVVNWENDGYEMKYDNYLGKRVRSHNYNGEYAFQRALSWTTISTGDFCCRYADYGFIFDTAGPFYIANNQENLFCLMGLLQSKVSNLYLRALNPTINFPPGYIQAIPFSRKCLLPEVDHMVGQNITLSRIDWDSFETSWDFQIHPLVRCASFSMAEMLEDAKHHIRDMNFIKEAFVNWSNECYLRFEQLKANEEELNRIFIDIYGLQDELTPEVEDKDVTVRKADLGRDIRSFISYAVGCMFGRYSLDMPGLAFAGGSFSDRFINAGNPLTDESGNLLVDENGDYLSDGENCYSVIRIDGKEKLTTFAPDYDNILPICDDEYFEDDIVSRFVEFVETVYGKETLEENLKYIADALGGKGSPREVIRNYFLNDFYADHLKVYQKRPIYWLFDSGKKNGFKCLIYMHRYQPDTIARIRTDYVHELQSRYRTAIDELERRISDAATAERVKLNKQLAKLQAQADELRDYEEKIHHLADQMISIDLDDGVKVNYAKFQDVLAKIK